MLAILHAWGYEQIGLRPPTNEPPGTMSTSYDCKTVQQLFTQLLEHLPVGVSFC